MLICCQFHPCCILFIIEFNNFQAVVAIFRKVSSRSFPYFRYWAGWVVAAGYVKEYFNPPRRPLSNISEVRIANI